MEVKDNHRLRYFELVDYGWCCHISSPLLEAGLKTFKEKRLFYKRFMMFKKKLNRPWSARTNIDNYKMRSILEKLGANAYKIDEIQRKIYYLSENTNEGVS